MTNTTAPEGQNNPMGSDATKHDFPDVGELNLHETTDAALWADQFNQMAMYLGYTKMDEGWLLGWFANAICAGRDAEGRAKDAEIERLRKPLIDMITAIQDGQIDSPELGGGDVPVHRWHEEWLHHAEQALKGGS